VAQAVRFEQYGDVDVLQVVDVEPPTAGPGEVVVAVKAAGINPGEAAIRKGLLHDRWPATFPSGQGSDLAGVVQTLDDGVARVAVGDEVIGFTDRRASHAALVVVEAESLTARPAGVSWEAAGSLYVAGTTAYACVRAVAPREGEVVVVAGAAGGVGTLTVQLARRTGATVIGLASEPHHAWLRDHGTIPVTYGDGVSQRIADAAGAPVAAFVDAFGSGYVDLALELGVAKDRINTIIDMEAAARHGVKAEGNATAASADVLAELAGLVADGALDVPIAATYPLTEVRAAYRRLEERHTLGKIVLIP
jgi:NADPH:quinone reductase-like Zn-dependent oxidoreductase